jgi:16S rRNA (guanine1207-N2)-methyltransferase
VGSRRDEGWRDRAAIDLLGKVLATEPLEGPALLVDYPEARELPVAGEVVQHRWDRVDGEFDAGAPWPVGEAFRSAFLRLPRSRESLEFALHATASVLLPGAPVFVFGAKDEGIGSTAPRMESVLEGVASLATGGRCRVLRGYRDSEREGLRGRLEDWREVGMVDLGLGPRPWTRYPGTFARRGLDPGTSLLLAHLPDFHAGGRVLDFGAGTGVLAAGVRNRDPEARLILVEPDALSRAAAVENVPGATFASIRSWPEEGPFDAVVSNPPYHQGKSETLAVVGQLISGARACLAPKGELRLVLQRRHPVEPSLQRSFRSVKVVADEGPYRVWAASGAEPG